LHVTDFGLMQLAPVNNVEMTLKLRVSLLVTEISLVEAAMAVGLAVGQATSSVTSSTVP